MLNTIPADPDREMHDVENLMEYLRISTEGPSGLSREEAMLSYIKDIMPLPSPPPKSLPCANVQPEEYKACDKPGTQVCAACRLVSYCSKDCQRAHWKKHKIDCKMSLRSDSWKPAWRSEGRRPIFMDDGRDIQEKRKQSLKAGEFNGGTTLWGNMPATDVINLKDNEGDETKDLSLAFVASGDLRHVVRTVNALPSTYSGHLDILINDTTPQVACRNLLLLLILGSIPDEDAAVDIALHFWYSAFWPINYRFKLSSVVMEYTTHYDLDKGTLTYPVGDRSSIQASYAHKEMHSDLFLHYTSTQALSNDDAQAEYHRVYSAPSRRDFVDRIYCSLKPSHRVAFHEYRRFGLVLPFGAANSHFNCPNASLFSFGGRWLQTDFANPLEGWNLDDVVKAGRAHGAQAEDIYGCLYFLLSDELRAFHQRMRTFSITFKMFDLEATKLSEMMQNSRLTKYGLPASTRFDRIEVSNILDFNYIGIEKTLTHVSPLLARTDHATIVGYFMNWFIQQKGGRATDAGEATMKRAMKLMMERTKSIFDASVVTLGSAEAAMLSVLKDIDLAYDHSKPFSTFLRSHGLESILQQTGLTLRDNHKVVPHRLMVPIKSSASALPEFPSEESCYYHTKLWSMSWAERYVEFGRKSEA